MHNTQNYMELPYNPKLLERAKKLRKAGNVCEVLLWKQLKQGKCNGYDFDRQKVIGNFIVDFFCAECGVVIEVDGDSHNNKVEYDIERNVYLEGLGLTVVHVLASDVLKNLPDVVDMLQNHPALLKSQNYGEFY